MEGNKEGMVYAEPLSDIHMPNNSILPFVISLGLFISAFGAMYHQETTWGLYVLIGGIGLSVLAMIIRSLKDDHGYHIHKEDLMDDKGGNV